MKKILKRVGIVLGGILLLGFLAFLYYIPPFTSIPQEEYIRPYERAHASLDHVTDPTQRRMAERGRYIVKYSACSDCHTPGSDKGPDFTKYLAGGMKFTWIRYGTVVSRNLTPHPETGLAKRTDEEVKRVLRSGVVSDGRVIQHLFMPWGSLSNMTEEDRHAVLVYLRNIKPVEHRIPPYTDRSDAEYPVFYGFDYGASDKP